MQQNGSDSSKEEATTCCLYRMGFECTAAPARSLDSLESGRLMLTVKLQQDSNSEGDEKKGEKSVRAVAAKLVNRAKQENLISVEGTSELKRKTSLLVDLACNNNLHPDWWEGVIGIPITWTEGGTTDYERSGSWHPKSKGNLFTMEITYTLKDGSNFTSRFDSEDVYHWPATL
ncbi:MAG TPA: hypothetical protein VHA09_02110 [Nitrososphaera sp.]|nr:hypothetical protein [Nitrososphaera sp.]